MRRFKFITAAAVIGAAGLSGCSLAGSTHQSAQAGATDKSAAGVSQMASGFRNINYKCIKVGGSWFAAVSTSDGGDNNNIPSGVAIAPDPSCKTFGP